MMDIHPIKTKNEHEQALLRIDALMNAEADTDEGAELDVLVTLVEAFENEHFPIPAPDPVAAILFRMDQMGLDRKALEPFLGGRNRVSEVLNKKRNLSMTQIRKLHEGLNIPFENLMGSS